jgi:hypothetical protein
VAYLDGLTRIGLGGAAVQYPGFSAAAATAAITGTLDGSTEADIVAGGQTIIITLTNDTFVAFNDTIRQAVIDGLDSAQSETLGWNNEVRDKEVVGAVSRDSDTQVTITLTASPLYNITASETITVTVPASALTGASALTATPTAAVDPVIVTKGGRILRKRRYSVEVEGEFFAFNTISEVESFLVQVRENAEQAAEKDVRLDGDNVIIPKPPRVRVKTGAGKPTTSKTVQTEVRRTQKTITSAYARVAKRSQLLRDKIREEEDEDAILALLL